MMVSCFPISGNNSSGNCDFTFYSGGRSAGRVSNVVISSAALNKPIHCYSLSSYQNVIKVAAMLNLEIPAPICSFEHKGCIEFLSMDEIAALRESLTSVGYMDGFVRQGLGLRRRLNMGTSLLPEYMMRSDLVTRCISQFY